MSCQEGAPVNGKHPCPHVAGPISGIPRILQPCLYAPAPCAGISGAGSKTCETTARFVAVFGMLTQLLSQPLDLESVFAAGEEGRTAGDDGIEGHRSLP